MSNIHVNKFGKYYDRIETLYNEGKFPKEIAAIISDEELTPRAISRIASAKGFAANRASSNKLRKKFDEIDKQALGLIKSGMNCSQVARRLGIDQQSMNTRLKMKFNLSILPDGKKQVDSHFFDVIDSEEKAYWLGFFYADGYNSGKGIELTVKSSDKNHLKKFKQAIKSKHNIGHKIVKLSEKEYGAYRISIKDKGLSAGLSNHGCYKAKTFDIKFPDLDSLELYRHFVRGFIDGDGCISKHASYIGIEITCASYSFIRSMQDYFCEVCKIKSSIRKDEREKAYSLKTTSRDEAIGAIKYLYNESNIYLDRKYKQFLKICRHENILQDSRDDEDGIKRGWRNVG